MAAFSADSPWMARTSTRSSAIGSEAESTDCRSFSASGSQFGAIKVHRATHREERKPYGETIDRLVGTSQTVGRIAFCYTPKPGSLLNIAECELSAMTRQSVAGRRIGELSALQAEIAA